MKLIFNTLYLLAITLYSPKIIYRMIFQGRYRKGWPQRLGRIERKTPAQKCIWIHAVSVGEVNATQTLIKALKAKLPEYEIVISSTTDTGLARAKAVYGDEIAVFYFPFDLSWIMKRAFDAIAPDICVLMELEVWPNLIDIADRKKNPVVVANGRLSDRSFPRYKLIRPLVKRTFSKVSMVLAQSQEYAKRFRYLGCAIEKVQVTNSLKYDTAQTADKVEGADELSQQLNIGKENLWVAGGTGPGEEKIILDVFAKLKKEAPLSDLRLAIVPRKPERFNDVATLAAQYGYPSVRYSEIKTSQREIMDKPDIIIGDTMGDLRKFYSLASVVFIGRTLVPMGGSDMMESTALGKCTIFGPHTFNFKQTVDVLLKGGGAIEVKNEMELFEAVRKCLCEPAYATQIASNGRQVIKANQGATEKTVQAIVKLLN